MTFDEEMNYFDETPFYTKTNESLESIIYGIDLKENDNILAILGSGDQSFSLLSKNIKLTSIDNDFRQIKFVKDRINYLKGDNFENFIKSEFGIYDNPWKDYKREYFFREYFYTIKENISNLNLIEKPINFFDFIENNSKKYNKIYLSNILCFNKDNLDKLIYYKDKFSKNTLIYITDYTELELKAKYSKYIKKDLNLTKISRKYNHVKVWTPTIYIMNYE